MKVESESKVTQSCPTLSNPMNCSLPGSSVHRIFQARVLEWVAIAFSDNNPETYNNPEIYSTVDIPSGYIKPELCLSVSCGGMGHQWTASGQGLWVQ